MGSIENSSKLSGHNHYKIDLLNIFPASNTNLENYEDGCYNGHANRGCPQAKGHCCLHPYGNYDANTPPPPHGCQCNNLAASEWGGASSLDMAFPGRSGSGKISSGKSSRWVSKDIGCQKQQASCQSQEETGRCGGGCKERCKHRRLLEQLGKYSTTSKKTTPDTMPCLL